MAAHNHSKTIILVKHMNVISTHIINDFYRGDAYSPLYFKFVVTFADGSVLEILNPTDEEMATYNNQIIPLS